MTIILLLSLDKRGNYYNVGFGNVLRIFKLCKTTKQLKGIIMARYLSLTI